MNVSRLDLWLDFWLLMWNIKSQFGSVIERQPPLLAQDEAT